MKRTAGTMILLAALGGCVTTGDGPYGGGSFMGGSCANGSCGAHGAPMIPGVQGPYGQPVAMAAPYSYAPPSPPQSPPVVTQPLRAASTSIVPAVRFIASPYQQ